VKLKRYRGNPVLEPVKDHPWESRAVFNCGVVELGGEVHILYRGFDRQGISRWGYARSSDGLHITERLPDPVYGPSSDLDRLGCEDPRISRVGDRLMVSYTAYGVTPGMQAQVRRSIQVAITSIAAEDLANRRWNWAPPTYPFPGVDNKGAVIFPEPVGGRYVMYHRIPPHIWVAYSRDLRHWGDCNIVLSPQREWEYYKVGTGAPPIRTDEGWLVIYHAVDRHMVYRLGYVITALDDPTRVIYRHPDPILEPEREFETQGMVSNIVFTCGAVVLGDTVYVYYGGADTVICVATARLEEFLRPLRLWQG